MRRRWIAILLGGIFCAGFLAGGCQVSSKRSDDMSVQTFEQKRTWNQEKNLKVQLGFSVGNVILQTAEDDTLFSLEADYHPQHYQPIYEYDENSRALRFDLKEIKKDAWLDKLLHGGSFNKKNRLILKLSPKTILDMELKTGVGTARMDFTGMQVRSLDLETGVGETLVSCHRPNPIPCEHLSIHSGIGELETSSLGNLNFTVMDYRGGIGSSDIDFSGVWGDQANPEIRAEVGIGELTLRLPAELGAEIRSSKHFLNDLKLDSFVRKGDRYLSKNYEEVQKHMVIRMSAGIGSMRVRWQ